MTSPLFTKRKADVYQREECLIQFYSKKTKHQKITTLESEINKLKTEIKVESEDVHANLVRLTGNMIWDIRTPWTEIKMLTPGFKLIDVTENEWNTRVLKDVQNFKLNEFNKKLIYLSLGNSTFKSLMQNLSNYYQSDLPKYGNKDVFKKYKHLDKVPIYLGKDRDTVIRSAFDYDNKESAWQFKLEDQGFMELYQF